jgi:hypothetical protein
MSKQKSDQELRRSESAAENRAGDKKQPRSDITEVNDTSPPASSTKQGAREETALPLTLYQTLIGTADFPSTLRAALKIVCELAGWILGTAWLPSEDGQQLRLITTWCKDDRDPTLAEFIRACERQTFSRGVGIPGRV